MRNNPTNSDYLRERLSNINDDLTDHWRKYPCLLWERGKNVKGYGQLVEGGKMTTAHRVAYALVRGAIPDDLHVCHHCDIRACFRPIHLFLGTNLDNVRDMCSKGRNRVKHGPTPSMRGELNPHAKLTAAEVLLIRKLYAEGVRQVRIAKMLLVDYRCIWDIVHRKNWAHI